MQISSDLFVRTFELQGQTGYKSVFARDIGQHADTLLYVSQGRLVTTTKDWLVTTGVVMSRSDCKVIVLSCAWGSMQYCMQGLRWHPSIVRKVQVIGYNLFNGPVQKGETCSPDFAGIWDPSAKNPRAQPVSTALQLTAACILQQRN